MQIINFLFITSLALLPLGAQGQVEDAEGNDDLVQMLESGNAEESKTDYTTATFKTTRIINGHSIENTGKGVLDFRISHRFGPIKSGISEFFGLDNANTRIGFDYGLTNWLTIGIGRSTYDKEYDGFLKARILRQTDDNRMPLSLSYMGAMSAHGLSVQGTLPVLPPGQEPYKYYFSNRLYYANQLLIARKFSESVSLQIMPTHVHYNLVDSVADPNDIMALGIGGRIKLSSRISFNVEYYYMVGDKFDDARNSLSVGFDIETGGHVFQLMFTNATAMTERAFIAGPGNDNWADGGIHFGFNISRVFTIVRPKEFRNSSSQGW